MASLAHFGECARNAGDRNLHPNTFNPSSTRGTAIPVRVRTGNQLNSLGDTRQALQAGGRPQLAAGIRAGSYAYKCIFLSFLSQCRGSLFRGVTILSSELRPKANQGAKLTVNRPDLSFPP